MLRLGSGDKLALGAAAALVLAGLFVALVIAAPSDSNGALGAAAIAAIAVGLGLGATSALTTAKLLRDVEAIARRVAAGDLAARAPSGGADSARLGKAMNLVTAKLSESLRDLRIEKGRLDGILDGMSEGILVVDPAKNILLANRAVRSMTIDAATDPRGRPVVEHLRHAVLLDALDRAAATGEVVVREIELGAVLPRRFLVRVTRSETPAEPYIVIAVFHDVTDLRRLETIRTDFVANVSHELRTPIAAIAAAAETLLGGALQNAEDAAEFADVIERQAKRLRHLVDDLLDLSKLEAKGFQLDLSPEPILPVLERVVKLSSDAAGRRNAKLSIKAAPGDLRAAIDRRALEQVVTNLVDNAIKYGGPGATIVVSLEASGDRLSIGVKDNGPGIAKAHVDRIFERFYRVDTGRSRELGGTGLGLAIVKHLVELMHGNVEVESELGKGTRFVVQLPACHANDTESE